MHCSIRLKSGCLVFSSGVVRTLGLSQQSKKVNLNLQLTVDAKKNIPQFIIVLLLRRSTLLFELDWHALKVDIPCRSLHGMHIVLLCKFAQSLWFYKCFRYNLLLKIGHRFSPVFLSYFFKEVRNILLSYLGITLQLSF